MGGSAARHSARLLEKAAHEKEHEDHPPNLRSATPNRKTNQSVHGSPSSTESSPKRSKGSRVTIKHVMEAQALATSSLKAFRKEADSRHRELAALMKEKSAMIEALIKQNKQQHEELKELHAKYESVMSQNQAVMVDLVKSALAK